MTSVLDLGDIPFYWRTKLTPNQAPHDIPTRLPFVFTFDGDTGLVIQKRQAEVLHWLERVYLEDANVGYLQDGHALAESYGGEFLDFFKRASKLLARTPKSAADIGCGGTYLLQRVRELGIAVKGIDPSPVTAAAGQRVGIEIVPGFYPSPSLTERFDILFHYDVLEHIEDPASFLRAHHENLTNGGAVVFAVPDCTHHIAMGDVSMLLHEHLNYFDANSLERTLALAGFRPLLIESARHGGVLLCCAVAAARNVPSADRDYAKEFERFRNNALRAMESFSVAVCASSETGLYVPLRAFPYLGELRREVTFRFFDDDPGLHGRYYDGFDMNVENRDDLLKRPCEQVIVCSLAFGKTISRAINEKNPDQKIVVWRELFGETSV